MLKTVHAPHLNRTVKFGRKRPVAVGPHFRLCNFLRAALPAGDGALPARAAGAHPAGARPPGRLLRRREVPDEKNKFYVDYDSIRKFLKQVQQRKAVLDLSTTQTFPQVQADIRPTPFGWGNLLSNSR